MDQNTGSKNISNHLANERTLLAWVRTGIGIMAFGFVVVKFSLFIREISLVLGKNLKVPQYGYSAPIGILLVAVGALCLLLSLFRYHKAARQIDSGTFHYSPVLLFIIVGFVFLAGIALMIYLLKTA
jgi:putative membrane protein